MNPPPHFEPIPSGAGMVMCDSAISSKTLFSNWMLLWTL